MVKTKMSTRAFRAMKKKEPQVFEGEKRMLALRGPATSLIGSEALTDLALLKKPELKQLTRKNEIRPFEDAASLEFLCEKNECAAFLYSSHNKKRPNNLVLGRIFDGHIYDMIELGVSDFSGLGDLRGPKKALGSPPCFIFQGDGWDRLPELTKLREVILDTFGARDVSKISLAGIDNVISVTSTDNEKKVLWRAYHVTFKRSGSVVPKVELQPMGPNMDLTIRRTQFASADLEKEAHRIPKELTAKRPKNVSKEDTTGETMGRIHMERQDFNKLELRKTRAHKAERRASNKGEEGADDEAEGAGAGSKRARDEDEEEEDEE